MRIDRTNHSWGVVYLASSRGADDQFQILAEMHHGQPLKLRTSDPLLIERIEADAEVLAQKVKEGFEPPLLTSLGMVNSDHQESEGSEVSTFSPG